MIASTYEQKQQTKMVKHLCTVSFSDDVTTHEIPKLDAGAAAEVYYSRSDYRRFQISKRIRDDRYTAKQMRRMIEDASATMEVRALDLAGTQAPFDDLLLVKPPTMPVRQTSVSRMKVSDLSTFEVAVSEPPTMPVRQLSCSGNICTDVRTANVKLSKPPTRPVRQVSKRNVIDMAIVQAAIPTSPGSRLNGAIAV
jgi:hypothetical protein